jgi:type IV pilus assembly protein PilC
MPNYFYTAKSFDGQTKNGTANAKDMSQLAQSLKREGLILVKADLPDENKIERKNPLGFLFNSAKISDTERILMTRNLWIMTVTGLSPVKIFDVLSLQTKNVGFKKALLAIREKINKGQTLSESLSGYPAIFSDLFLSMVKAGEESGTLEEVFKTLSLQLEKDHQLRSKIQGAMIYPVIILLTMAGVGVIIVTVVLPKLNTFFSGLNAKLPIYTTIVLGLGNFALQYWPVLIITPLVLIFSVMGGLKTKAGKKFLDTIFLKIPLISKLVRESNCALLIRALSSLIAAGVPIVKALEIVSGIVGNYYFKQAVSGAVEKVKKGESLSSSLKPYQNIFPSGSLEMIQVGEETGKTAIILKRLAEFYEDEVVSSTEKLSSAIEPVLILVLGICVAIFAISIIEPMYSVLGSIS